MSKITEAQMPDSFQEMKKAFEQANSNFTNWDYYRESPTGRRDGENTTFYLSKIPFIGSEKLFLNGVLLEPMINYSIDGGRIELNVDFKLRSDDVLTCIYHRPHLKFKPEIEYKINLHFLPLYKSKKENISIKPLSSGYLVTIGKEKFGVSKQKHLLKLINKNS